MTIDSLLALRNSERLELTCNIELAKSRAKVSKLLAENFEAFNKIRNHLFNHTDYPLVNLDKRVRALINMFHHLGWIAQTDRHGRVWRCNADNSTFKYLNGSWLEEYAFLAHLEAVCDEAYFGQEIYWNHNGTRGKNEIDVLARRGEVLSFTSCKSIQPYYERQSDKLHHFLFEAAYWDKHFANDGGRVLLITTADFYNELQGNLRRFPTLVARSQILQVDMVGLEELKWDVLVDKIRQHWETSR